MSANDCVDFHKSTAEPELSHFPEDLAQRVASQLSKVSNECGSHLGVAATQQVHRPIQDFGLEDIHFGANVATVPEWQNGAILANRFPYQMD